MKTAIATIETKAGKTVIFFNGRGEELTADDGAVVEEIGYKPVNMEDAINAVKKMYRQACWNLEVRSIWCAGDAAAV